MNIGHLWKGVLKFTKDNTSIILTVLAGTAVVGTVIFTIDGTVKAVRIADEAADEAGRELTKREIVEKVWKCYIPALLAATAAIACMVGATAVDLKKQAALASLYGASQKTLQEYKAKAAELIGGKDPEQKLFDAVASGHSDTATDASYTPIPSGKQYKVHDLFANREFYTNLSYVDIKAIENDLNYKMQNAGELYMSVNEVYDALGWEHIGTGNMAGFNAIHRVEFLLTWGSTDSGDPVLFFSFKNPPILSYDR